ncbi:ATP-binding cassette domain-containing protein [Parabacteroides sp. FAFU027]|uniref:ATP-binding cassette domain-containing protein n=1 Tax=Parabacteroides sp. FAFU027 TaxID=2922715 RepID=UPI001FB02DCA|nr:ATP-binding cassette domain-containing protein [Parabacteroides sp. FAFU027]
MSETLLEALMQLFALLSDIIKADDRGRTRSLVNFFLSKYYSKEFVEAYLERYDFYLDKYQGAVRQDKNEQKGSSNSERYLKILEISRHVNAEMEEEPRVILIGLLLNFMKSDEEVGEQALAFVSILARELQINENDYRNINDFILKRPEEVSDKAALLLISGNKELPLVGIKHIYNPPQQVLVWVLHVRSTNSFFFRYSGPRNLYMNGTMMEQDRAYLLNAGSIIKTSLMPPVYYGTIAEKFIHREDKGKIIYRAIDIEYKFNATQIGIHKFSFRGRSGQLVAVMGGSGTGKSTLLNVLNGSYKLSNGSISVNGYDLHAESGKLQGVIGFVPQDDMLIEELTVFENLYYNAKLCFSHIDHDGIVKLVEKALSDFDLVEARDLVVGNPLRKVLSGGQRKRLNIALELIREPSILFVDEPTSGLSSMDSEKVIVLLKRQTLKGRLVIINIHQPSSDLYKLIDKLLIIDKGGHIIYNGNPMDAIVYFKKQAHYVNAEERECNVCGNVKTEQPLRIIEARIVGPNGKPVRKRRVKPEDWYQLYLENFERKFAWKSKALKQKKEKLPANLYNIPGRFNQFKTFIMRDTLAKIKDKQYLLINLLEAPVLAVILGFFTKFIAGTASDPNAYVFSKNENLPAYLFMSVVVALFLGLNVSAEEIIKDRKLLKREQFLNLSRFSYLSSKIVILFTISAIQSLLFVLIGNSILEIQGLTFSYWAILFSTACFANILGLNISSGLNSVVSIYILIPLILVPQILFSGVIVNFDKLHRSFSSEQYVPVIGDMMTSRWAFEALSVNQFMNNKYESKLYDQERGMSQTTFIASSLIPELESLNENCKQELESKDVFSLNHDVKVIGSEIEKIEREFPTMKSTFNVGLDNYDKTTYNGLKTALTNAKQILNDQYKVYRSQKDVELNKLAVKLGGNDALFRFKEQYYNDALSSVLLKKDEFNEIRYTGDRFIQKRDPVYQLPSSDWGRAHFYSPVKILYGITIPTPLFNVLFIWLSAALFYIALYCDLLRKLIKYIERFRLRRINQRLQRMSGHI